MRNSTRTKARQAQVLSRSIPLSRALTRACSGVMSCSAVGRAAIRASHRRCRRPCIAAPYAHERCGECPLRAMRTSPHRGYQRCAVALGSGTYLHQGAAGRLALIVDGCENGATILDQGVRILDQ